MQAEHTREDAGPTHAAGDDRHARRWQDVLQLAQVDLAATMSRTIADGRFDRDRYQNWLAMESIVCRIGALSLDAVACWHGSQPPLRDAAHEWAVELREHAQAAARDVRVLDGMAGTPPTALRHWHTFVGSASGSQRAGEVLGAALVPARLLAGPVRAVLVAVSTLPFGRSSQYVPRRLQAAFAPAAGQREALLDAYSATALALGAQRAANWYRAAIGELLAG